MNTPIDYSFRYSFGHFCCRVKQRKRLSEFLQKYTDSGTEHRGKSRTKLKNQILHNLAMFTSYVLSNKCFRKMKHARL